MKLCIVVCVLLVVAYHEASASMAMTSIDNSCEPKDVHDFIGKCVGVHCRKKSNGIIHTVILHCPPSFCTDTRQIGTVEENPNDMYPKCCPTAKCA